MRRNGGSERRLSRKQVPFPRIPKSGFLLFFLILGCSSSEEKDVAFYHWKSEAEWSEPIARTLERNESGAIYMHYFDVDRSEEEAVYPEFVLREVDEPYGNYQVVPVVFLTQRALEASEDLEALSERIRGLVEQIHRHHFDTIPERIQLDCDWTESSRESYFDLLKELGKHFELEVTLRLHQIKYRERTGVPPVERATLMLYNVGEIEDLEENSILSPSLVDPYLSSETSYPLELDLALPLFEQTVIKDEEGEQVRLINEAVGKELQDAGPHFRKKENGVYKVLKDTLFKGFYLYEGDRLKPETVDREAVLDSYRMVEESGLEFGKLIFYHLDDELMKKKKTHSILEAL